MKNWLNLVELNSVEIKIGEETVIVKELTAGRFLPLARLLIDGKIGEFFCLYEELPLPLIEKLSGEHEAMKGFFETFWFVHLGEKKEKKSEKEVDFFEVAMKAILKFSELWGLHPLEVMKAYSIRQLLEIGEFYLSNRKEEGEESAPDGARETVDEFGCKVVEWEE